MSSKDIVRFKVVGRRLWVPKDLYEAIERHASQRGQTVEQWVEEAAEHIMEELQREGMKP